MKHARCHPVLTPALSSCTDAQAISYDNEDGKPRNSYERQREVPAAQL